MTCQEFEALLSQQRTDGSALEQLQAHAQTCARCRMLMDCQNLYAEEEVPEEAAQAWRRAVRQEEKMEGKATKNKWARVVGSVAAALVVAGGAVGQMDLSSGPIAQPTVVPATGLASYQAAETTRSLSPENGLMYAAESMADMATYDVYDYEAADEGYYAAEAENGSDAQTRTEKIIRNASLTVKTRSFDKDLTAIETGAVALGGRVASSSVSGSTYRSASLTLRIPAERLDEFLESMGTLEGRIANRRITSEDVSDSYYDTETRLNTQRAKLERLQALIAQAQDVEALIELEGAISDTQYQIDRLTGTLRGYDSRVAYSTVDISLQEEKPEEVAQTPDHSFFTRLGNGIKASFSGIAGFIGNAVIFIVMALPWLLIAVVIVLAIRWIVKKKRRKNQ